MNELLIKLYKEKYQLENRAESIITKYISKLEYQYPKLQIREQALKKLVNSNTNDYSNWTEIQKEIIWINKKCCMIGMKLKGMEDQDIKQIFNYKPEIDLKEVIGI